MLLAFSPLRRIEMYIRIDQESGLFKLLQDFLVAYNHRTSVIENTSEAAFQSRIDALAQDLKTSTDVVETAIKDDKGE